MGGPKALPPRYLPIGTVAGVTTGAARPTAGAEGAKGETLAPSSNAGWTTLLNEGLHCPTPSCDGGGRRTGPPIKIGDGVGEGDMAG